MTALILRPLAFAATAMTIALSASPVYAAHEDGQLWLASTTTIRATDKVVISGEAQMRFEIEGNRKGPLLLRPAIGYRLGATETVYLGYVYVKSSPLSGAETYEHRPWQQLAFRVAGDGKGITLTGRTRLEQRMFTHKSGTGHRLRQQMRLTAPVHGRLRAVGWTEGFFALNDTAWGQRSGFERVRNFAGISVPLNKTVALEPGYINEWVSQRSADRFNHIASLSINASF